MKTLCETIESCDIGTLTRFSIYLNRCCDFTIEDVEKVFEKPWNWEAEFSDFLCDGNYSA